MQGFWFFGGIKKASKSGLGSWMLLVFLLFGSFGVNHGSMRYS